MATMKFSKPSLSPLLWLYVPVLIAIAQKLIEIFVSAEHLSALHSETGPHETLQFLIIAAAFVVSVSILLKIRFENKWLSAWVGVAALACFYIAGEEISWGQHIFDWGTPEFWSGLNDQGETNLHNTSSWLDQKPRLLLLIGVITGGLIIPFLQKFRADLMPQKFEIIYPPAHLAITAGFTLLVKIIDKVQDAANLVILTRPSEVIELYMFYFVFLYLIALRHRLMQQ